MNWFDIAIVAVVLGAGLFGFKVGLTRAAFLFAAFILGAVIGAKISILPASLLEDLIPNPDVRYLVSFTAVFLSLFVVVNVIGSIVCKALDFTHLKWIDSWIGSALGLLAGVIFVGLAIMYLIKSPVSGSEEWLKGSALVPIMKAIISPIFREFMEKQSSVALYLILDA